MKFLCDLPKFPCYCNLIPPDANNFEPVHLFNCGFCGGRLMIITGNPNVICDVLEEVIPILEEVTS
jgi:hypothetical protein